MDQNPEDHLIKIPSMSKKRDEVVIASIDISTENIYAKAEILQSENGTKTVHIIGIENLTNKKGIGRRAQEEILKQAIQRGATRIRSEVVSAAIAHLYGNLFGKDPVFETITGERLSPEEVAEKINTGKIKIAYLDAEIPENLKRKILNDT
ncbi:MAG: hypothetical protein NZM26_01590 [Patescibacteria group bacterium]|nr:hypothetical protein [Patescibacteria group bacterium]